MNDYQIASSIPSVDKQALVVEEKGGILDAFRRKYFSQPYS